MTSVAAGAEAPGRRPFSDLSEEEQRIIREKTKAAKEHKLFRKKQAVGCDTSRACAQHQEVHSSDEHPTKISQDEYFDACPRRTFYDAHLVAGEKSLDLLMAFEADNTVVGKDGRGQEVRLSEFQYFLFAGSPAQLWDPIFYARLAFEGFFTITTSHGRLGDIEPLPELQPFYGVVDWRHMNRAKHVKKALNKLKARMACETTVASPYFLYSSVDTDRTFKMLDQYQKNRHGTNWMTQKYFDVMKAASANPDVNFRLHSVELYAEPVATASDSPRLVAGEIGYTIGRVYTSLSGFYDEPGAGTMQLALLGKWLEHKGYSFWSLGHCYSPQMEYKRELGHRIYPRKDFLRKLKQHRGNFRGKPETFAPAGFSPLLDGEQCDLEVTVGIQLVRESPLGSPPS